MMILKIALTMNLLGFPTYIIFSRFGSDSSYTVNFADYVSIIGFFMGIIGILLSLVIAVLMIWGIYTI